MFPFPFSNLAHYTYTYDSAGNLQTEVLARTTLTAATTTYAYDADNQLTGDSNTTYAYDATGNRASTNTTGVGTLTYSTSTGNEMASDGVYTYTYDNAGNETGKTKISNGEYWTYGYNNRNELISAVEKNSGGTLEFSATYKYDAFGNQIESDETPYSGGVAGTTAVSKFVMDAWQATNGHLMDDTNWNVLAELNGSGSLTNRFLIGDATDELFANLAYSGGTFTPYWYLTDVRGSVRDVITNSGTVVNSVDYSAFGQILAGTDANPSYRAGYAWTGRQFDVETQLQYNRARWYDPATGRWMTEDPMGFDAGDSNLYRYVKNQPTEATDPSGMDRYVIPGVLHDEVGVDTWQWDSKTSRWKKTGQWQYEFHSTNSRDVPWWAGIWAAANNLIGSFFVADGTITGKKGIDANNRPHASSPAEDMAMREKIIVEMRKGQIYNLFLYNCNSFVKEALQYGKNAKGLPLSAHVPLTKDGKIPQDIYDGIVKDVFGGKATPDDVNKYIQGLIPLDGDGKAIMPAAPIPKAPIQPDGFAPNPNAPDGKWPNGHPPGARARDFLGDPLPPNWNRSTTPGRSIH